MAFKIIAGDFPESTAYSSMLGTRIISWGWGKNKTLDLNGQVERVELVTEESKKKFLGSAGWGLVGGLALGPLGLLAGVLAGGNKKEVCFACHLKDGRKFMAIADSKTYQEITGLAMHVGSVEAKEEVAVSKQDDVVDKLERLAKLKEQGVITEEEFQEQKKRILAS